MSEISVKSRPSWGSLAILGLILSVSNCNSLNRGKTVDSGNQPPVTADDGKLGAIGSDSTDLDRLYAEAPSPSKPVAAIGDFDLRIAGTPSNPSHPASAQPGIVADLPDLLRDIKTPPNIHAVRSAGGRELAYWVFGDSGPVTLILGGMHGTEYTPTVLSAAFIEWLEATPGAIERGRMVVAPLVDPDGFASRRRGNDHGVDLNRNYPATNWRMRAGRHGLRPLSEPETRFVMDLLEKFEPRCIVSIHGPLACVNYDGPAEELARRMSRACGLPVRATVGYATPGSFGSYAGIDRQIPTITLELRPGRALDPDFDACRQALMAAHEYSLEQ